MKGNCEDFAWSGGAGAFLGMCLTDWLVNDFHFTRNFLIAFVWGFILYWIALYIEHREITKLNKE